MYCPKCKQQVSGDICPVCGYKSAFKKMDDLGGNTMPESLLVEESLPVVSAPSTSHKDKPAVGGFKSMDVLPGATIGKTTDTPTANTGDKPASNGFKSMEPFSGSEVHTTGGGNTVDTEKVKPKILTKSFNWKRWLSVAACVIAVGTLLMFLLSGNAMKEDAKAALKAALNEATVEVDAENLETPEFLRVIEEKNGYTFISLEKTESGAIALLRVHAPDVYSAVSKFDGNNSFSNSTNLEIELAESIKQVNVVEQEVELEFKNTENGLEPILTADFLDAYYGGVLRLRADMIAAMVANSEVR